MKKNDRRYVLSVLVVLVFGVMASTALSQSTLNCQLCHSAQKDLWLASPHANTQTDVAEELAAEWAGQPPDSVILGPEAEDCVACHGPTAVTVAGGMTEVEVMAHFFTTTNGMYTDSTRAIDTDSWPHIACVTCHDVPDNHPATMPVLAYFNSTSALYDSVRNVSSLCGRCHGTLRFADTDHRRYDAWRRSRHGHGGQGDVASELAEEWAGNTPDDVINGPDGENCIACHAPTAVELAGGMSEAEALGHFFTTSEGVFTSSTVGTDTLNWPEVTCNVCHNPHNPDALSFFNSTTRSYQVMSSSNDLCGQCHGNLRFPDTDHLSYNIEAGTGGVGVPDMRTMPGVQCVDCHMHQGEEDETNSLMYGGHSWSVFVREPDGSTTASCTVCHGDMSADSAMAQVETWQAEFTALDSTAQAQIEAARSFLQSHPDTVKKQYLEEAEQNLAFAESDESGGVHNHHYVVSLINDAIEKASLVLTGVESAQRGETPTHFALSQNYPNPFNSATAIKFWIPRESDVRLVVYDVSGRQVRTLLNSHMVPGNYRVVWDGRDDGGKPVPSGVYLYRLEAGEFVQGKRMILLK